MYLIGTKWQDNFAEEFSVVVKDYSEAVDEVFIVYDDKSAEWIDRERFLNEFVQIV
jgi:hypothetical protein